MCDNDEKYIYMKRKTNKPRKIKHIKPINKYDKRYKKLHKKGHCAYGKDAPHVKLFKRMFKEDKSFREYILCNKIDLDNLHKLSEDERARWVRKILWEFTGHLIFLQRRR